MDALFGFIGITLFLVGVVIFFIRLIKRKNLRPATILLRIGIVVFILSLFFPSLDNLATSSDSFTNNEQISRSSSILANSSPETEQTSSNTETTNDTVVKDSSKKNTNATSFKPGIYRIGETMPAGEYKVTCDTRNGYYKISSDANGEDIVSNEILNTFSYFVVQDSQYLNLEKVSATPISEAKPHVGKYTEGTYKVGFDITAGEYELKATSDSAYIKISADANGINIVSNDIFDTNKFIQIADGQYLTLKDCEIIQ